MKRLTALISLFVVLLSTNLSLRAQQSGGLNSATILASRQLEDVRLRGYSLAGLLSDLSLWYDIPIGLEVAMNSGTYGRLRMDLKTATLEEVLNQFVAEHSEYSWEIREGVVNVFPKDGWRDPIVKQILGTEIAAYSIKEKAVTFDVEKSLLDTPELATVMNSYGLATLGWSFSGFYFPNVGSNFKLDVSNMTVQSILNSIVNQSKTAKFWSISRDSFEHTLSINVNATQEGLRQDRRIRQADFDDLDSLMDFTQ